MRVGSRAGRPGCQLQTVALLPKSFSRRMQTGQDRYDGADLRQVEGQAGHDVACVRQGEGQARHDGAGLQVEGQAGHDVAGVLIGDTSLTA